ncbi:hypothetical protein [Streptantibioticus parmotrematis]|uniref:hypothetical protein n=1 Tax=Streptantibioticus parmotrematis TaxID=2873249 RepID=UPI00207C06FD|nr:hypothetical protein [Streptantibioticus parmotrematis]
MRTAGRVRPAPGPGGACALCAGDAAAAMAPPVPVHPGHGERRCGCHRTWAQAMRAPARDLPTVPQRLTIALLKPGAPRQAIRARLRYVLREVHVSDAVLTPAVCDRLYPDAYGAAFVDRRTAYLTSGPVQVVVLAGDTTAVTTGTKLKRAVRDQLRAGPLRNHLHMPDNPGEALADIALLAGWDVLRTLYERWEMSGHGRHTAARVAGYRAYLERHGTGVGVVGPRRPPGADEPADDRR